LPFSTNRVPSLKRIGPHNYNILCIVIGSLLGDGHMERENSTLALNFRKDNKESKENKNNVDNNCTELVIWGSNLGSSINKTKFTPEIKNIIKFSLYHRSVIIGLILSDGSLPPSKLAKNVPLMFAQSLKNFKYFWFVFTILAPYCPRYPYYWNNLRKGTKNHLINFTTRRLPCFTELYHLFYKNKKKILPEPEDMYELLTPVAIAHWFMGDGGSLSSGLKFGTDSFSVKECVLLINILKIKYNINSTIQMNDGKPRIYILANSKDILISLIKPHMVPSMYYKFGKPIKNILGSKKNS
jgi:hypothetical protein